MKTDLIRILASIALAVFLVIAMVRGNEPGGDKDARQPESQKDPTRLATPASKPAAETSPEAQAILDKVRDAYAKLVSLQLAGTLQVDFDVNGDVVNKSADFTATFIAPNKFRHELKNMALIGSTGEKIFAHELSSNKYMMADAPKDRVASKDIPKPVGVILDQQNPSLLLAIVTDAGAQLLDGVSKAEKVDDVKIGDVSFVALHLITTDVGDVTLLFDQQTNLVRRLSADLTKSLESRGQQNVKKASVVIDYTEAKPDAPVSAEQFAWAPPAGAKDAAAMAAVEGGEEISPLVGKAAPDFALKGMDDKEVKLTDFKGKVIVLDFWATWCPPCRASLPHLDKLGEAMKDRSVQVFAVNGQEEKNVVQEFIEKTKLTTAVLLDSTGAAAEAYGVRGIPQTVIIGKDGKVKKVTVGFNEESTPGDLEAVIKAALAE